MQRSVLNIEERKVIFISRGCGVVASLAFLMTPVLATAQRPIVSACRVSPATVPLGGTATVHVEATSPEGLPLQYIYSVNIGSIHGDGASATYTADGSASEDVTILCEAMDTRQRWTRGRGHIRVTGAGSATAPAPEQPLPAKEPAKAIAPSIVASNAAPQPRPQPPAPQASASKPATPPAKLPPVQSQPTPLVQTHPQPPAEQAKVTPPAPQPASPPPTPAAPTPAVQTPAPQPAQPTPKYLPVPSQPTSDDLSSSDEAGVSTIGLKNGLMECHIPLRMTAGTASRVTVKIHGSDDGQGAAPDAGGGRSRKLSQYTLLLLSESQGEFNITSLGNPDVQLVPEDGAATWSWSVVPVNAAKNQKLQVRLYREEKSDVDEDVNYASFPVNVIASSRMEIAMKSYTDDPDAWWKYWLPSGAILILLVRWVFYLLTRGGHAREEQPRGSEWP